MANLITSMRILCSMALLFSNPLSASFFTLYIIAGLTDMIDGSVARVTATVSSFGAKLDTMADAVMVVACFIKLFPVLYLENWMYLWICVIAGIKVVNILSGYIFQKKLVTVHSVANRMTGALLFALPLFMRLIDLRYSAVIVGTVATFAAIQEGHFIRSGRGE